MINKDIAKGNPVIPPIIKGKDFELKTNLTPGTNSIKKIVAIDNIKPLQ